MEDPGHHGHPDHSAQGLAPGPEDSKAESLGTVQLQLGTVSRLAAVEPRGAMGHPQPDPAQSSGPRMTAQSPPACQISPSSSLEGHDNVRDLQVPFFFQLGQDPCPEEDLTLSHAVQVGVQLQGLDL